MSLADGSTFGPYRILGRLGRGGMAAVYRAYEPALDRTVALKVLPEDSLDNETAVQRFKLEAKAVARLVHPNIVPVHAFGVDEATRTPWMALQLVEGGSLAAVLALGPVPERRALGILRGIAKALDHAHAAGVLHRDVKPQNVLVAGDDHVYLADFGLARILEASAVLSAKGAVLGTPTYMAPEQALGEPLDAACDIYALGVVAYQMLTGLVPFTADTPLAVLMKHVREPIPLTELAEPLLRPLLRALAKSRQDRWPTALEFVAALEQGAFQLERQAATTEGPTLVMPPGGSPAAVRPDAAAAGLADAEATVVRPPAEEGSPEAAEARLAAVAARQADAAARRALDDAAGELVLQVAVLEKRGHLSRAVELLSGFDPPHAKVTAALQRVRGALELLTAAEDLARQGDCEGAAALLESAPQPHPACVAAAARYRNPKADKAGPAGR